MNILAILIIVEIVVYFAAVFIEREIREYHIQKLISRSYAQNEAK
jgi:hypothetical protein